MSIHLTDATLHICMCIVSAQDTDGTYDSFPYFAVIGSTMVHINSGHNTCIWSLSGIFVLKENSARSTICCTSLKFSRRDTEIGKCLLF